MDVLKWVNENKDWLFEGIGVTVLLGMAAFFFKKKNSNNNDEQSMTFNQTGGTNSKNTQAHTINNYNKSGEEND